jgi:hypothetical protein
LRRPSESRSAQPELLPSRAEDRSYHAASA